MSGAQQADQLRRNIWGRAAFVYTSVQLLLLLLLVFLETRQLCAFVKMADSDSRLGARAPMIASFYVALM